MELSLINAKTKFGQVAFAINQKNLYALKFGDDALERVKWDIEQRGFSVISRKDQYTEAFLDELNDYFEGKLTTFSFQPIFSGTDFQKKVYQELMSIQYGKVITYGELAERAGRPGAARAVGTTMAKNRIAVVVPCHRVIGSQGSLGGYGYGLDMKKMLLQMENCPVVK